MSEIRPRDPSLLTDQDVDYGPFQCCGDEDLVFLRCAMCGHIWVECYECSTWYVDLDDLTRRASSCFDADGQPACPQCGEPFADNDYLREGVVDRYLPTRAQVVRSPTRWPARPTRWTADETEKGD